MEAASVCSIRRFFVVDRLCMAQYVSFRFRLSVCLKCEIRLKHGREK